MKIKSLIANVHPKLTIVIGIFVLISIAFGTYIISNTNPLTNLFSYAAGCTQSRDSHNIYTLSNGKSCSAKGITTQCGGTTYMCPGPGYAWTAQSGSPTNTTYCTFARISACAAKGQKCDEKNKKCVNASSTANPCAGKNCPYGCDPLTGMCMTQSSGIPPIVNNNQNTGQSQPCPGQQNANNKKKKSSSNTGSSQACNDNNCKNIKQGSNWGLNNCDGVDPDGDMQICNKKGRIGICRETQYCCPGPGLQWTADMTACPIAQATLTVSPLTLSIKESLTATYSSIPAPTTSDWLGLYKEGEKIYRDPLDWNYARSSGQCNKESSDGKAKGTCTYYIPETIPNGRYVLYLFSSDSFTKIAASEVFTITNGALTGTPTQTPTPTPSGECCACPTPTPVYPQSGCNGSCMTSYNCSSGQVCLLGEGFGWVCRNPACADSTSCNCTALLSTPTPTQIIRKSVCSEQCSYTSDCKTGYRCVYLNDQAISICRNPKCYTSESCICPRVTPTIITKGTEITPTPITGLSASVSATPTPFGFRLNAVPTATPSPTPIPINPALTIKPFTDSTGKAPPTFTLTGTSDPFTTIDIQFNPDSVGQTTTSDAKGNWRYILTKSLALGKKDLTVTARTASGGETQIKQSFTVKGGGSFFSIFLGFILLTAIGGIGFFIYQRQIKDQSSLFSQFPPVSESNESMPSFSSETESTNMPTNPTEEMTKETEKKQDSELPTPFSS